MGGKVKRAPCLDPIARLLTDPRFAKLMNMTQAWADRQIFEVLQRVVQETSVVEKQPR